MQKHLATLHDINIVHRLYMIVTSLVWYMRLDRDSVVSEMNNRSNTTNHTAVTE